MANSTSEYNRGTALERVRDCGWNYREIPGGFEYVSRHRVSACVSEDGKTVNIGFAPGGDTLFTRETDGGDLFMTLANVGRCVDKLSSTFREVDDVLATL